jgi:hypothetical protein
MTHGHGRDGHLRPLLRTSSPARFIISREGKSSIFSAFFFAKDGQDARLC